MRELDLTQLVWKPVSATKSPSTLMINMNMLRTDLIYASKKDS